MPEKPRVPEKADDKDQSERFIETARNHEADETDDALDRAFKRILQNRQQERKQQKPPK